MCLVLPIKRSRSKPIGTSQPFIPIDYESCPEVVLAHTIHYYVMTNNPQKIFELLKNTQRFGVLTSEELSLDINKPIAFTADEAKWTYWWCDYFGDLLEKGYFPRLIYDIDSWLMDNQTNLSLYYPKRDWQDFQLIII